MAPGLISRPSSSVSLRPSACSIPAPQSFEELPPSPMIKSRQPLSRASVIICPTPYVVVYIGLREDGSISVRPQADAISIMAVVPLIPYEAFTFTDGRGPVTSTVCKVPFTALVITAEVPSPPSATSYIRIRASGTAFDIPSEMATPAS